MDISIIITAHKDRGYLNECLSSIYNNGFPGKYEIILASDGNEDLRKFAEDNNILFSLAPKGTLASNFNHAATLAKGKYLKIVADDDMLYKGCLQQLFDAAEYNKADLVYGDIKILKFDKSIVDYQVPLLDLKTLITTKKLCGGANLIKTSSFRAVLGFDEKYSIAESYILYFKFLNAGHKNFVRLQYPIAIYRHHSEQKSLHLSAEDQQKRANEMAEINKIYSFTNENREQI